MSQPPKVFISYAREDELSALQLYRDIKKLGALPWIDKINLLPGTHWKSAIQDAIRNADYVLLLLTNNSVNKRGFVQNEIYEALLVLESIPPSNVFIIPVRQDNCQPQHDKIKDIQWVDLFINRDDGIKQIALALGLRGNSFNTEHDSVSENELHINDYQSFIRHIELWMGYCDRYHSTISIICIRNLLDNNIIDRPTTKYSSQFMKCIRESDVVYEDQDEILILVPSAASIVHSYINRLCNIITAKYPESNLVASCAVYPGRAVTATDLISNAHNNIHYDVL